MANDCCSPCAEHSNPPGACLDCDHCHICHIKRDFKPSARLAGSHPVALRRPDGTETEVFHEVEAA